MITMMTMFFIFYYSSLPLVMSIFSHLKKYKLNMNMAICVVLSVFRVTIKSHCVFPTVTVKQTLNNFL